LVKLYAKIAIKLIGIVPNYTAPQGNPKGLHYCSPEVKNYRKLNTREKLYLNTSYVMVQLIAYNKYGKKLGFKYILC